MVVEGHDQPEQITRLLAEKGVYVSELSAIRPTLESFFLKLTGRPQPPEPTPAEDPPIEEDTTTDEEAT